MGRAQPGREVQGRITEAQLPLAEQSFPGISRFYAERAFTKLEKELDTYTITDIDWPISVETPGGDEFSCGQYYYD